jgi:hypothetical protein
MTFIPALTANVSQANSTSTVLAAGATFTGTPEDVSQYASLSVAFYVQPSNATGNVLVQFSNTASPFYSVSNTVTAVTSITAGGFTLDVITAAQYFRVVYVNDTTPQTALMIQSIFHPQARIAQATTRYAQQPTDYTDVLNTRAIIWGKTLGGGIYEPVATNGENSIVVTIAEPHAAFGEISTAENTATCQVDFVYGINTNLTSNTTSNNATVTSSTGMAVLTTGAQVNSVATLVTKEYVKYRPGQGSMSRFTALFTTGVAGSTQFAGPGGGSVDGIGFGYNGTSFGVLYRHNSTDTWIPQSTWNYDTMLGGTTSGKILVPTNLNVYQVKFQYLGGGNIFYYILNDFTGRWVLVHMVKNAGNLTAPNLRNPSMPVRFEARNTTNTSALVIKSASIGQFLEGPRRFLGPRGALDALNISVADLTQTNIMAFRNATTFNGTPNYAIVHIRQISFSANKSPQPSGCVNLRIIRNPTTTFASFTPYSGTTANGGVTITSGNSVMSSNVVASTISGGQTTYTSTLSIGDSQTIDVTEYDINIYPGDVICFVAYSSVASVTVGTSTVWNEDI